MPPRIRKIVKTKQPMEIIEIDDDVQEITKATEEIEKIITPEPVGISGLQARLDAILEESNGVPVKPEAVAQVETLPAKIRKERKKKQESNDALIKIPSHVGIEDGEIWAEVQYAIDAQRTYTLGAKRKIQAGETMAEGHSKLYKQVL